MSDSQDQGGFNGQVDERPPARQETEAGNVCARCWTAKGCRYFVIVSVFIVAVLLIGVAGILGPFLLIYNKLSEVGPYIFCIYCLLFGILILLLQFRIKFVANFFVFLLSYYFRAFFIMFLGTLALGVFEDIPKIFWIGYVIGPTVIVIGVLHIVIGCCNDGFAEQQSQPGSSQSQHQQSFDQQQQGQQQQQQSRGQQPQQNQGYDPNRSGVAAAVAMPETQQFAMQAGTVAGRAYLGGASREEAMNAAMADQNVQRAAGQAVIAGAKNDQVRGAAIAGASNAASAGYGAAYDSMFD